MKSTPSNHFCEHNYRGLWGPAWRFKLAQTLRPRSLSQIAGNDDLWVRNLAMYLARKARGASGVAPDVFSAIADAEQLQGNAELAAKTKLMVLADMAIDEMHQRLDVPVATLQAWEAIYFHVRDLCEATDWLAGFVIDAERKTGNAELAARMKLAMSGGVVAVRLMLDSDAAIPLDEADRLLQRKLKLHVKFDQVVNMSIDSERARLRFLAISMEMHLDLKRLELATRKLEQQCAQARDRHELAKLQIELAMKREEQRAAEWQRTTQKRQRRQVAKQERESRAQDLHQHRLRAEQLAWEARIAASPLVQFAWGAAPALRPCIPAARFSPLHPDQFEVAESIVSSVNDPNYFGVHETAGDFLDFAAQQDAFISDRAQLACVE